MCLNNNIVRGVNCLVKCSCGKYDKLFFKKGNMGDEV